MNYKIVATDEIVNRYGLGLKYPQVAFPSILSQATLDQYGLEVVPADPVNTDPAPLQVKDYVWAVQELLDRTARVRNYDGILSACSYAASTNLTFKAEGEACVAWRDGCWAKCYEIMGEVQAEERTQPTIAELLDELPDFVWP